MMEAVARRKAHWLFGAGSENVFSGKRRPQEDMVTSAVFGSIRLMPPEDRRKAIELALGAKGIDAAGFAENDYIDIVLWPRLAGLAGRKYVEPDVLLCCAEKTLIVEVKWHAQLSERQIEQQIEAVGPTNVRAVVVLGGVGVEEEILNVPCFRRTWRDVSSDLQAWTDKTDNPLSRWVETMHAFLQETDMGRVFKGIPALAEPGRVTFRFSKPGHPPWFDLEPSAAQPVRYTFEGKQ